MPVASTKARSAAAPTFTGFLNYEYFLTDPAFFAALANTLILVGGVLAITVMLYSSARRGGSLAGAWYWVCGVPLLGPVTVGRFDVVPVTLSVAALCVTGRGGVRGALIGAGTAVKAWPVTLLAGMAPGQQRRGTAAAAAVLAAVCAIFASGTASFLAHQNARVRGATREEVLESVAARQPLGRLGTDDEIAAVIVFLCSEGTSNVAGAAWSVDGGAVPAII